MTLRPCVPPLPPSASPRPRRVRRPDGGAAAVEFAIILPLLLAVVFGVIDFGRMMANQITLNEAAREGARAAAFNQPVQAQVDRIAPGITVSFSPSPIACTTPDPSLNVTVTVYQTWAPITPLGPILKLISNDSSGANAFTQRAKGVMQCAG
jgi:Flp pilus assembly protein TadG